MPTVILNLPVLSVLLIAAGAMLLKRGYWPRRTGRTPHCRVCDYILSDGQEKCSECGTVVQPGAVIRGERHRRPALAAGGATLTLFGVGLLVVLLSGVTSKIDWNRYKPLSWLLHDLDSATSSTPAWVEIQRRLNDGLLSEANQNALVDKTLQLPAAGTTLIGGANPLDFVGKRFLDHKLTSAQADQFFASALKVRLAVRTIVGAKSRVPYSIAGTGHGPDGWWLRMRTIESQVDGGPVERIGGGTGGSFGGWTTTGTTPPVGIPGRHRLRVRVEMATDGTGGMEWDDKAPVAKRITQDLFADFEAIDGQTPIATVTAPTAAALAALLTPRLTYDPANAGHIETEVDAAALPVDVAFDVFIGFNDREVPVGGISFRKGAPSGYGTGTRDFPADPPPAVELILRSSQSIASGTVDMTRIWMGEIVIPNVPVHRPAGSLPATTQSTSSFMPAGL